MIPSGAIFLILIAAVLLAAALAWVLAALYQRRMLALMSGSTAPDSTARVIEATQTQVARAGTWGSGVDFMANRRATTRLMLSLGTISLLIALTQSWLDLLFVYDDREISLNRLLMLGAIYAWPMVLAWGLARRWSWLRILSAIALYLSLIHI